MNLIIYKTGYSCGVIAFLTTIAFIIAQILQILKLVRFPYDEIFIYGTSLLITIPFLLELLALHYITIVERKIWSHAALLFTIAYLIFVTTNYIVQLAVVLPAEINGKTNIVSILKQSPHSMFWYLDCLGYIYMGIAAFFVYLSLPKEGFQHQARYIFLLHSLTTPITAFIYIYPDYSNSLLLLSLPWAITAPAAMIALAIVFRKKYINELPHHSLIYKHLK